MLRYWKMETQNQPKKYPQIRIPPEEYEVIKDFQQKRGFPTIWEAIKAYYASKDKKIILPTIETMEKRLRKEIQLEYQNFLRAEREEHKKEIQTLKNENEQLRKNLEILSKENESLKAKFQSLENEHKALKEYHNTVLEELNRYKNSPIDDLVKSLEEKDSEIRRLNESMEELKSKTSSVEEVIKENERLKMENESLKNENREIRLKLEELYKDSVNRAKELKFIKDVLENEINRIRSMDSVLDIKLALKKLQEDGIRKINYELEREERILGI
jgi:chromosome segregation ATPase